MTVENPQQADRLIDHEYTLGSQAARRAVDFYDNSKNHLEAERLQMMADIVDGTSIEAIGAKPGDVVADFGAGDSPSLGLALIEGGARYVPLDQRAGAVNLLVKAGLEEARVGSVTRTELAPDSVDVAFSRFVFGWLSPEARAAALREMIRVVKPGGKVVVMDYDWGAISGSTELCKAAAVATDIMGDLGFNPLYGQSMSMDLDAVAGSINQDSGSIATTQSAYRRPSFKGSLQSSFQILKQTAGSIEIGLRQLGMNDRMHQLQEALRILESSSNVETNGESVRLADTVVKIIDVEKSCSDYGLANEAHQFSPQLQFKEFADYRPIETWGSDAKKIVLAVSSDMVVALRRTQARAYVDAGLVYKSGIKVDGTLADEIDSPDQVSRSKYFTTIDEKTKRPLSCVRYIACDERVGLASLRAFGDLPVTTAQNIQNKYEAGEVIEISAFAKDFEHGGLADVVGAVIAMSVDAKQQGYKVALMELQENQSRLIRRVFGEASLTELSGARTIDIEGVNGAKLYKMLQANPQTFLADVFDHAKTKLAEANVLGLVEPEIFRFIYDAIKNR